MANRAAPRYLGAPFLFRSVNKPRALDVFATIHIGYIKYIIEILAIAKWKQK